MQFSLAMKTARLVALLVLPAVLLSGCYATSYRSQTWGADPYGAQWARYGHVESVRENVRSQQGDPGAGAVAGAIIGGLLFGGRNPAQTIFGMGAGAMVGAAASSGAGEDRYYEVFVRFDDGALERYVYQNVLPFRPGEPVVLSAQGLSRR
jgi:outer membrane lipoprotein SlyB